MEASQQREQLREEIQAGDGSAWMKTVQVHAAGMEGTRVKVGTDPVQSSREPDGGGPRFGVSGASFLMPFGMPGWQMPCPVIGCQRSPPAWVVLCRGRQQSGGGLPFKLPAGHPAHVHRFLENPENSKGIPSPTRPWNFVWLHLDSGPGTFLSATFPPPQRQQ